MVEEPWAQLGDAINAIRAELERAEAEGRQSALKFRTGPVELEFTVEVKAEGRGTAKVFVLPWSVQAEAGAARDRLHRLKLTLQPVDDHGHDRQISDQSTERPR